MKTFKVRILAFGKPGEVREVDVPDEYGDEQSIASLLETIFYYGQNDFQPKEHPSVSVGDVIEVNANLYLVCGCGFRELMLDEYRQYSDMPQVDRSLHALTQRLGDSS